MATSPSVISSTLLVVAVASDVLRMILRTVVFALARIPEAAGSWLATPPHAATVLWSVNVAAFGAIGVLWLVGFVQARCPLVVKVDVPVENLPRELDGFRIVQISDLHIGPMVHRRFVERVVETVNELAPDLIAMTGDIGDGKPTELRSAVEPLARLRAADGAYYVTGNHEYYWDAGAWIDLFAEMGIQPLINRHRIIERGESRLAIAGVSDFTAERLGDGMGPDPGQALSGVPDGAFRVLLAHQPKMIDRLGGTDVDLQLSGHTHGGQYFPFNLLIRFFQPIVKGLHRRGSTWLYVNRGTGYWGPPTRLGVPGEITLLRLTRG